MSIQERSKETVPMPRTSCSFKLTVQMSNTGWTHDLKNAVLVQDDGTIPSRVYGHTHARTRCSSEMTVLMPSRG